MPTCVRRSQAEKDRILQFVEGHPDLTIAEIAPHLQMTKQALMWLIHSERKKGRFIERPGHHRARRFPKRRPGQSKLEYEWETHLSKLGLGMNRGSHSWLIYGWDRGSSTFPGIQNP